MTFTKEQLINQAREEVDFWRERDELIPSQQTAIRLRLAEITLAALRAKPVMYTVTFEGKIEEIGGDCQGFKHEYCQQYIEWLCDEDNQDGYAVMPLYTAPPAPAPVVPEEFLSAMEELLRISDRDHDAWHKVKTGIVSCRAAMLQGAEPVQEWIPCSERMPEKMVSVLATGEWFDYAVTAWDGGGWLDFDYEPPVTHWMPLPAAPQQH